MNATTFSTALGLLAVIAALAAAVVIVGAVRGRRLLPAGPSLVVAWGIAAVATTGSLVFSEVYHFTPCALCWYQRILMYPLAILLGIAAWRGDLAVRRCAIPLAGIGAGISTYHVLVERLPAFESGACDAAAPCSVIWVEALGFLTIPTMALVGFAAIVALLATARPETDS